MLECVLLKVMINAITHVPFELPTHNEAFQYNNYGALSAAHKTLNIIKTLRIAVKECKKLENNISAVKIVTMCS